MEYEAYKRYKEIMKCWNCDRGIHEFQSIGKFKDYKCPNCRVKNQVKKGLDQWL